MCLLLAAHHCYVLQLGTSHRGSEVILLLDVLGIHATTNANHPQELVNVIRRVAGHPAKDNKHVVNIQALHNFIGIILLQTEVR
jgi:hypothetical protein